MFAAVAVSGVFCGEEVQPGRPRPATAPDLARSVQTEGESIMDFRPLNDTERRQLVNALRGNAENDRAILIDQRDTSFAGTSDEVTDDEVISAIKSVPCHY
jgi:hypothetical protein